MIKPLLRGDVSSSGVFFSVSSFVQRHWQSMEGVRSSFSMYIHLVSRRASFVRHCWIRIPCARAACLGAQEYHLHNCLPTPICLRAFISELTCGKAKPERGNWLVWHYCLASVDRTGVRGAARQGCGGRTLVPTVMRACVLIVSGSAFQASSRRSIKRFRS